MAPPPSGPPTVPAAGEARSQARPMKNLLPGRVKQYDQQCDRRAGSRRRACCRPFKARAGLRRNLRSTRPEEPARRRTGCSTYPPGINLRRTHRENREMVVPIDLGTAIDLLSDPIGDFRDYADPVGALAFSPLEAHSGLGSIRTKSAWNSI